MKTTYAPFDVSEYLDNDEAIGEYRQSRCFPCRPGRRGEGAGHLAVQVSHQKELRKHTYDCLIGRDFLLFPAETKSLKVLKE